MRHLSTGFLTNHTCTSRGLRN